MKKICVTMSLLGDKAIFVDGRPVNHRYEVLTQPWCLFCILALAGRQVVHSTALAEELWPDKEVSQAVKCLKNTVYLLRTELTKDTRVRGDRCIEQKDGGYRLGGAITLQADFVDYNALHLALCQKREAPFDERFPMYCGIANAYKGHFCSDMSNRDWPRRCAMRLAVTFLEMMGEFMNELWERGMHEEIRSVYQDVRRRATPCDEMNLYWFRALHLLGDTETIRAEYPVVEFEYRRRGEAQNPVFTEIRYIATQADDVRRQGHESAARLKDEFSHNRKSTAQLIEYSKLKELFAGTPARYAMAIFTFELPGKSLKDPNQLKDTMEAFIHLAQQALRGHDLITPYSENQCLIVLPNHSEESSLRVKDRLSSMLLEREERPIHFSAEVMAIS